MDIASNIEPSPQPIIYAHFWQRLLAIIIDLALANIVIAFAYLFFNSTRANIIIGLMSWLCIWLYFALMESSNCQGTLGKMAMRIKVVDINNNLISFGRATGRYFSKFFSGIIIFVGYFMMLWTSKKQCLHDKIADTFVIKKG